MAFPAPKIPTEEDLKWVNQAYDDAMRKLAKERRENQPK
jgi:hypothetical protein